MRSISLFADMFSILAIAFVDCRLDYDYDAIVISYSLFLYASCVCVCFFFLLLFVFFKTKTTDSIVFIYLMWNGYANAVWTLFICSGIFYRNWNIFRSHFFRCSFVLSFDVCNSSEIRNEIRIHLYARLMISVRFASFDPSNIIACFHH